MVLMVNLMQKESLESLRLDFVNEISSCTTAYRFLAKFHCDPSFLKDEGDTRKSSIAVIQEKSGRCA